MEAVEQGRLTGFTSRYEAWGILTGASDDIAPDLIREGGYRAVGLAFRRTRKDRMSDVTGPPSLPRVVRP